MQPIVPKGLRRWIGASALAIIVAGGGVSATLLATSQQANAQIQNTAQITVPPAAIAVGPNFADLVDAVKPAVVSIQVEGEQAVRGGDGQGGGFSFDLPDLPPDHPLRRFFDQFGGQGGQGGAGPQGGAAPEMRRTLAAGSGFIVSADGYIVTNNHVVEDSTKVTVRFDDGDEMTATVVGTDKRTDLAVIKVDATDLPFVKFAHVPARVGEWVVAVGNPFGLASTVTAGIISASGRDLGDSGYGDYLQIDAAVNSGNSGGPAFNLEGQVVGVNTAIFSPNGGNVGIAFAIPADTVESIVNSLISSGSVTRGFLGVTIQDINADIADSVGLTPAHGALVTEPRDGGPAAAAGIKSGDIITAVDGSAIDSATDLSRTIALKAPETPIELTIWRDRGEVKVNVTLDKLDETQVAAAPPAPAVEEPAAPAPSSVGLALVPNAEGVGVLVQDVDPASVAAEKGFAVGDTIVQVDNKDVASADEFEAAIAGVREAGRNTVLIKAMRGGMTRFVGLPLAAATNG